MGSESGMDHRGQWGGYSMGLRFLRPALGLALALPMAMAPWLPASAAKGEAEYCVTCSGPDQTYRCRITGAGGIPAEALKLFCVVKTTKDGGHASCSASQSAGCQGIDKVYAYNGPDIAPDQLEAQFNKFKNEVDRQNKKFAAPDKSGEPKTLMDLGNSLIGGAKSRLGYGTDAPAPSPSGQTASVPAAPSGARQTGATAPPRTPPPQTPPAYRAPQTASQSESWAGRSYRCLRSFFRNCGEEDRAAN